MIEVDALSFLAKQAVAASVPTVVAGVDPRQISYLTSAGDEIKIQTSPKPRQHAALSLGAIVGLANRFKDEHDADAVPYSPVVWYSESKVSIVFDDNGHRLETAVCPLVFSDKWETAKSLRSAQPKPHREFIRFLRVQFAGVAEADSLADRLESIRFKDEQVTTGKVLRGSESMGRSITSEAQTEGSIPDEVTFSLPVYKILDLNQDHEVRFVLDVDADNKTFRLVPFPDEIEAVLHIMMTDIEASLGEGLDEGIPYYYGNP